MRDTPKKWSYLKASPVLFTEYSCRLDVKGQIRNQEREPGMHPSPEVTPTLLNEKYSEGVECYGVPRMR